MTDPYASVAEYYDIMIDWPARLARERPFFTALFAERPVHRVLDIGCGTGHHARLFAELGARVAGLDPSAPMIARARALTAGDNPAFVEGDFHAIAAHGKFDLITVLGNTLAYVRDACDLVSTLKKIRYSLAPGGRLCVQGVNYDSLLVERDRWLPLVQRRVGEREFIFQREYRILGLRAEFMLISLVRDGTWQQSVERSIHFPLTRSTLEHGLQAAGYTEVHVFGDFAHAPYELSSSSSLLTVAG